MPGVFSFAIPGDLDAPTGGYGYDRRVIVELARLGWQAGIVRLDAKFPRPSPAALADAERRLTAIIDNGPILVDGLAFGVMPALARRLAAAGARIVALVHHPLADEGGLSDAAGAGLRRSEREALAAAHHVLCTSRTTRDRLVDAFAVPREKITIASPGVDRQPRAPASGTPPLIVSLGTLTPRKGHDVLLSALARLIERDWLCRIVGAGDRDPAWAEGLRQRTQALGLSPRVTFAGAVPDAAAELRRADIFALASRHEGYGMVLAEAMAQGLPIVACRAGAVGEVVAEDAGLLVPPDDVEALADALGRLLDDATLRRRLGDASWAAGQALPTWDDTACIVAACLSRAVA